MGYGKHLSLKWSFPPFEFEFKFPGARIAFIKQNHTTI